MVCIQRLVPFVFRRGYLQMTRVWQVPSSRYSVLSKLCSAFMVAWSRLVSSESAIATGASSATHLHFVYEVTEIM